MHVPFCFHDQFALRLLACSTYSTQSERALIVYGCVGSMLRDGVQLVVRDGIGGHPMNMLAIREREGV